MELGGCPGKGLQNSSKVLQKTPDSNSIHMKDETRIHCSSFAYKGVHNCFSIHENPGTTNASTAATNHKKKTTKEQYSNFI